MKNTRVLIRDLARAGQSWIIPCLLFYCLGCDRPPAESTPSAAPALAFSARPAEETSSSPISFVVKDGKKQWQDPAPPVVQADSNTQPPAPKPHPQVKFHQTPKPLPSGAVTQDWPCFLGPTHSPVSTETRLLKQWPASGPPLAWELQAGTGYSSPVIKGGRLIFFHRVGDEEVIECLHPETGQSLWRHAYPSQYRDRFGYNNGPRSTPIIDEERVYAYGAAGQLSCVSLKTGEPIWKRDILSDFKIEQNFFGVGTSPLIEGELLILNIGAPGGPGVAAFEKKTGKLVWGADEEWGSSYASPVPADVNGERRVFVFAGGESRPPTGGLLSINPKNGLIDFRFPWRSKNYESVNAANPVVIDDKVFITASYDTGGALLQVLPNGGHKLLWETQKFGAHWNTPVHRDGYLYGFDGRHQNGSALVCYEVKTGKELWRGQPEWEQKVVSDGQTQTATMSPLRGSLLLADGHFLCLGEFGHLLWLDLSPKGFKELARVWLFAAPESWTLPVISRGLMYAHQNDGDIQNGNPPRLLCYDMRGGI